MLSRVINYTSCGQSGNLFFMRAKLQLEGSKEEKLLQSPSPSLEGKRRLHHQFGTVACCLQVMLICLNFDDPVIQNNQTWT